MALSTKQKEPNMTNPQPGDKVKVVDCIHGHRFEIGEVVEIKGVDHLDGGISCECHNETTHWWLEPEEFEKVE